MSPVVEETIETQEGSNWILPADRAQGVHTDPEASLQKTLSNKALKCTNLKTPCSELHLIIAFNKAVYYSGPFRSEILGVISQKAVDRARSCSASWPFNRTFLLIAVEDNPTVFCLH